jgi:hypothetical protein
MGRNSQLMYQVRSCLLTISSCEINAIRCQTEFSEDSTSLQVDMSQITASTQLWWRQFTRSEGPDIDHVADSSFLQANFVDAFGQLLQKNDLTQIMTLDQVIRLFYNQAGYNFDIYCVADGGTHQTASAD